jgi:hypothetical protein
VSLRAAISIIPFHSVLPWAFFSRNAREKKKKIKKKIKQKPSSHPQSQKIVSQLRALSIVLFQSGKGTTTNWLSGFSYCRCLSSSSSSSSSRVA